jgi:hypothetical protein
MERLNEKLEIRITTEYTENTELDKISASSSVKLRVSVVILRSFVKTAVWGGSGVVGWRFDCHAGRHQN